MLSRRTAPPATQGAEDHPVGVGGQAPTTVHGHVVGAGEVDAASAGENELAGRGRPGHLLVGGVGVHRLGPVALQSQDHRLVRAVAVPGRAQGAEQLGLDRGPPPQPDPDASSPSVNRAAARIGPTVCDDDGPMPTENMSRALSAIRAALSALPSRDLRPCELGHRVEQPAAEEVGERRPRQDPVGLVGDLPQDHRHGADRGDERACRPANSRGCRSSGQPFSRTVSGHRSGQLEGRPVGRQVRSPSPGRRRELPPGLASSRPPAGRR